MIKKHLKETLKNNELEVITKCITKIVTYLDVTFNLTTALADTTKNQVF